VGKKFWSSCIGVAAARFGKRGRGRRKVNVAVDGSVAKRRESGNELLLIFFSFDIFDCF
jgi:hypothetical protein